MDLYSALLRGAVVAVVVAWAAVLLPRLGLRLKGAAALVRGAAYGALLLDGASFMVHLLRGHRPGTPLALSWTGFIGAHPAFLVVAGLALIALWLSRGRPRKTGDTIRNS